MVPCTRVSSRCVCGCVGVGVGTVAGYFAQDGLGYYHWCSCSCKFDNDDHHYQIYEYVYAPSHAQPTRWHAHTRTHHPHTPDLMGTQSQAFLKLAPYTTISLILTDKLSKQLLGKSAL